MKKCGQTKLFPKKMFHPTSRFSASLFLRGERIHELRVEAEFPHADEAAFAVFLD
tara:strand:+ start:1446 stop:1610 length:165 start_codon:yes stop_codon:yes gene_type:complete